MKNQNFLRLLALGALFAAVTSCASGPAPAPVADGGTLNDYVLTGKYANGEVTFLLHATASSRLGNDEVTLLSGPISLAAIPAALEKHLEMRNGALVLKFSGEKEIAVDLPFRAQVKDADGWKEIQFTPAAANIRKLSLEGWPEVAKLELPDASEAIHENGKISANLPGGGPVALRWKEAPPETTGKLFFSAEGAVLNTVAPGILRQMNQITLRVLQGKLDRVDFDLFGEGEVTKVDGNGILSWNIEPGAAAGQRKLTVLLNAPRTGEYTLSVQLEAALPPLPASATPPRLAPIGASSYGGRLRVENEGTVRLEVADTKGLSQITPEQFPVARPNGAVVPTEAFAYRFADAGYSYLVRADNVQPEVTVNSLIVYYVGDTDVTLEAEIDLDIREAPLRELNLLVPSGWPVAAIEAPNLADRFVTPAGDGRDNLRLVFTRPLADRQVVRLRLEHNASAAPATGTADWALPPLEVKDTKSARGWVGVTSAASLRLTPGPVENLSDAGASTFPIKVDNLQAAWRSQEGPWKATVHIERLASSVQTDALQLFSVGEGLAKGATVINYNIAGAPVNVLRLQNTGNYHNIEFTGSNLDNWKITGDVIEVSLSHPVAGAYTLLGTYELPFKATGDSLVFTGLQPLGVQSEQGHVLVTSSNPFSVTEAKVSDKMVRLEAAEIPAEYRLLSDDPILRCYQYAARPFDMTLKLDPLTPASTVDQVVDIGELVTQISSTGEVLTTARYLLKSKSHDHLQLALPNGAKLWSVKVADQDVVPVSDKNATGSTNGDLLVPLPRLGDPNEPLLVELKYTETAGQAERVTVNAPAIQAPVLVTDWKLTADQDHRLASLDNAPVLTAPPPSALAWLGQLAFAGNGSAEPAPVLVGASNEFGPAWDPREIFWGGLLLGFLSLVGLRLVRTSNPFVKTLVGGVSLAAGIAGICLILHLGNAAPRNIGVITTSPEVRLSIPVVQAGHALSFTFSNDLAPKTGLAQPFDPKAWLLVPGIILALLAWPSRRNLLGRAVTLAAGSLLLLAGVLYLPDGPVWFCRALAVLLACLVGRALLNLRGPRGWRKPLPPVVATATTAALALFLLLGAAPRARAAATPTPTPVATPASLVLSITQKGTVQDNFVRLQDEIVWRAEKGAQLVLLRAPAVLTDFQSPRGEASLSQSSDNASSSYIVTANNTGTYKFTFAYQLRAPESAPGAAAVVLPTPGGLVNDVSLELARPDLDAISNNAVALRTTTGANGHPVIAASFAPGASPMVSWAPRTRDLTAEKPVYYADWQQIFTPSAGIIDGRHIAQIRLAQGEIKQLTFSVPNNLTISQVDAEGLSAWRFDPDQHKLLAYFEPARKAPFSLIIYSQATAAPLPYDATLEPIRLDNAAGEVGHLAAVTSPDVQLGNVTVSGLAAINLDDIPAALVQRASANNESYTVRRAYSFGASPAALTIQALAVEPDVRVESMQTLSLGEDRVVLAARLNVNVARAGIFKLSFVVPKGLELESLTGDQLSQWTESGPPDNRTITLNLKGKTLGNLVFDVTLSGPGVPSRQNWTAPHLSLDNVSKQTGQLTLAPDVGLRPHILTRDGLTQIDPKEANINLEAAPGVLVFRLLQNDWNLAFDVEKIDPWIETDVLQDVTVRDGLTEVRANIDYQISNAGVRELRLQFPAAAMGVHISGAQVSDTAPVDGQPGRWLVRLQRRSIGALSLSVTYQLPPAGADNQLAVVGIQAVDVNSQRGYVDLRARGRLETRVTALPTTLQAADWELVSASLRHDLEEDAPSQTFRVVDSVFTLPVVVLKHQAADILPARVVKVNLKSLVAPDGQLVTDVIVQLYPGDLRALSVRLPDKSKFWFAFVNDKGVTPSLDSQNAAQILLPLELNPIQSEATTVEFFYQQPGPGADGWNEAALAGPHFDLPLQNISWALFLPDSWKVSNWSDPWQKVSGGAVGSPKSLDEQFAAEKQHVNAQNEKANTFLQAGNQLLLQGNQMAARDLFSNAYQISERDSSYNEDARVQWQNLREQQAMVSLANGANNFSNNTQNGGALTYSNPTPVNPVLNQTELLNFTQQQERQILGANGAAENDALAKLAHSLVKQQADTLPHPVAIRATLPEGGQVYEFTQSLLVDSKADLTLKLTAKPEGKTVAWSGLRALALLGLIFAAASVIVRRQRTA